MFAFGFGAMIILTQMYGLGLSTWAERGFAIGFLVIAVGTYAFMGRLGALNEVIRIPLIDYLFIFIIYGLFLLINWIVNLFKRKPEITLRS